MDTIEFLIKAFDKYNTVKFTLLVFIILIIILGVKIKKIKEKKELGILVVGVPISCVILFMSMYLSVIEITNRFTLGVLDNTAATETELKFRRTFNKCNLKIIVNGEEIEEIKGEKDFTITVDGTKLGITKYVADLESNNEAGDKKLVDIIDIADAEFKEYEYEYIDYENINIKREEEGEEVEIEIMLNEVAYNKLVEYIK